MTWTGGSDQVASLATLTTVRAYIMERKTDIKAYKLNHAMIRVKDPKVTIQFYKLLGLSVIQKLSFPENKFDLYFLGIDSPGSPSHGKFTFDRQGLIELTHNFGTEGDDNYRVSSGNENPYLGFSHISISVANVQSTYQTLAKAGYKFHQTLSSRNGPVIALDPDGYWIHIGEQNSSNKNVPSDTRLSSVNQYALRVTDASRSVRYYTENLGMKLINTLENANGNSKTFLLGYPSTGPFTGTEDLSRREGLLALIWQGSVPHPFDPLSGEEIRLATSIVRKEHGDAVHFHVITLQEPRKAEMVAWLANPSSGARPRRVAEVVIIDPRDGKGHVYDGLVDLKSQRITKWERAEGQQPILIVEEMLEVEQACRKDPQVIEQCRISGIDADEMHKVYADPWTISHDTRYGSSTRLFQGLMYFRPDIDNCQYQYPLDFHPIYDPRKKEVIAIDIPRVRRPLQRNKAVDYHHLYIQKEGGYRKDLKPIYISQPEGVSFNVNGRELEWQNWKFHIGFNYREGIVFNNITFNDKGNVRPIFYRMSLSEMVVPYGHPEPPHHRKHAFDLGEYGAGYLTNSLSLGCDCKGMLLLNLQLFDQANSKGAIHYLDAELPTQTGQIRKIENAICIHEEDDGILFKHTDFRDNSTIVTRARKLIVQHVFTAANYEYAIQWVFHQDGTIQPDIKLTGILNTYVMNPGEDLQGYGTQVKKGVNAHNHQHLFLLRINPSIDGHENTVHMVDAVPSDAPVGSPDNLYGNAFYAKRTRLETTGQAITDYNGATSRSWDIVNENKLNSESGKPVSYKLVSRDVPNLMPKEGSLVWKRAFFARHAVHVTKYADDELWAAGNHVAQTSGEPSRGLGAWIGDGTKSVANTDIVLWHTFGITHFPAPEDFPVMPAEPITLLLRPRHFFTCNPVMDVPPSYSVTPSEVAAKKAGFDTTDKVSKLAAMNDSSCCKPPKL
ncbi:unnamed protein product [Fusarium fujikuroi]|uniref:Amine oxidase n=1 Tax=Fusarium fujikuroi TaxID=5127 RepID=A0A9Q9S088_FUSFU|nr:unnamed protein product [Fusarium fujikuroi]VTT80166.1 unnamed protein product [Fusarium fujikuroi]